MAAPATKKTPCPREIWKNGEKAKCGIPITVSQRCPNHDIHIMKFKTGFCANGFCEGTKARDYKGKPVMTCKFYLTCACKCHADIWFMSKMTGMDRQLMDNPEYVSPKRTFWLPEDDPDWTGDVLSMPDEPDAPEPVESPVAATVAPSAGRSFAPTATGRAARGQLEYWVKRQCDIWVLEEYTFPCTPAWIADEIASDEGIDPPSVGAIGAVFDRWVKLGFAECAKKPVRFVAYTPEGKAKGLDRMKEEAKRKTKLTKAENYRQNVR